MLVWEDTIVHVGSVDADTIDATQTFNASGLIVTPGFIDPHVHDTPLETLRLHNFLAMGVTPIVLGPDGGGKGGGICGPFDRGCGGPPSCYVWGISLAITLFGKNRESVLTRRPKTSGSSSLPWLIGV